MSATPESLTLTIARTAERRRPSQAPITVRAASRPDLPDLVELARRMHTESAFSHLPFVAEKVAVAIGKCMTSPATHFGRVAITCDGEIVGYIGGALGTYPFCDEILAHDLGFYVAPEHRRSSAAVRLARAFVAWARDKGARDVQLAVSSGVDVERIGAFYERLGLKRVGGIYRASLR